MSIPALAQSCFGIAHKCANDTPERSLEQGRMVKTVWGRTLVTMGGILALCGGCWVTAVSAQVSSATELAKKADPTELAKRLDRMQSELQLAKKALEDKREAEERVKATAARVRELRPPPVDTKEQDIQAAEQDRRAAGARALDRLQLDLQLDRTRKLEELLLKQLQ